MKIIAGSHLVTVRSHYNHHGIYAGNNNVIHYSGKSIGIDAGPVEMVSLDEFCGGEQYAIVVHKKPKFKSNDALRRAKSRIGEECYSLFNNNCEHFCNWCIEGRSYSSQVSGPNLLAIGVEIWPMFKNEAGAALSVSVPAFFDEMASILRGK